MGRQLALSCRSSFSLCRSLICVFCVNERWNFKMQTRVLLKPSAVPLNPGSLASRGLALLIVLFWSALVIIPLLVLLSVALKSPADLLNNPLGWPVQFVWSNFADAWNNAALGQAFFNSVLITSVTLLGLI